MLKFLSSTKDAELALRLKRVPLSLLWEIVFRFTHRLPRFIGWPVRELVYYTIYENGERRFLVDNKTGTILVY
jgi:hypothetical protein